jgi:hypothetical protein
MFRADVAAIAAVGALDESALAGVLREAASIEAFRSSKGQQVLAAARDVPDDKKDQDK